MFKSVVCESLYVTPDTPYIEDLGEDEYLAEENNFLELLGNNPEVILKIIDTLLDHPSYPYNKKELADVNGIAKSTLYRHWDTLEEHNIVSVDKVQGGTKLWTLNNPDQEREKCNGCGQRVNDEDWKEEHEIIEHLYKLSDAVMRYRRKNSLAETEKVETSED